MTGVLRVAPDLIGADDEFTELLADAVNGLPDPWFIARLPALRGGFDQLSAAQRERALVALAGGHSHALPAIDTDRLGAWAEADLAAKERLEALGLADVSFDPATRWRLVLGRRRGELGTEARRYARSLDQLWGSGSGEGSATDTATGAGRDPAYPSAREWGDTLAELFGDQTREDVAAAAVAAGDRRAVELLGEHPPASVELLSTVLSLAGSLPEHTLSRLRPILIRMVAELSVVLATQLRPALRGVNSARPTLRNTRRLDAPATIRRNLRHSHRRDDGGFAVVAATPVFRQPIAKQSEWHIIVVVDTSGSMEPSTVFAALTAAIFAGVPALTVTFLAFSTEVIDLTDHVDDPLALLLEIAVGGGTNIARALRTARARVRVPTRTMLVLITDFDEGGHLPDLLAQVAALRDAGVTQMGCAALDSSGRARYNVGIAGQVVAAGMPVSALSPLELARWVGDQVNR